MEEDILMCAPVQAARIIVPGSVESECADCGTKVLLSPSGQKLVKKRAVIIVCPKCALTRADKAPEPPEIRISQEAAGEVRAWLSRN